MTPTARTLKRLLETNCTAAVVEKWVPISTSPAGGIRRDVFGFGDVLAVMPAGITLIQATSGSNGAARVTKIVTECRKDAAAWLACGGRIEVWAWRKLRTPVDGRYWHPKMTEVTVADFPENPLQAHNETGNDV